MIPSNLKPVYDVSYFIAKFEAIPEDKWTTYDLRKQTGEKCALGHCGGWVDDSAESEALATIMIQFYELKGIEPERKNNEILLNEIVYNVNDGNYGFKKIGSTPKQRILAALQDIKKIQESSQMLSSEPKPEECDARKADSSNAVRPTIIYKTVHISKTLVDLTKELIEN